MVSFGKDIEHLAPKSIVKFGELQVDWLLISCLLLKFKKFNPRITDLIIIQGVDVV